MRVPWRFAAVAVTVVDLQHFQGLGQARRRRLPSAWLSTVAMLALCCVGWSLWTPGPVVESAVVVAPVVPAVTESEPLAELPPPGPALPAALPALGPDVAVAPDRFWAWTREQAEAHPLTHPPGLLDETRRWVQVVTLRARVTAYTPYDHANTEPHWADGKVAWFAGGKPRRVSRHPHGLATDWTQFPPGATFVRIPGWQDRGEHPWSFWVVDDACGRSRQTRRAGGMPVIDMRVTRRSHAIGPTGWGSRIVPVEVIFPAGHRPAASLKSWIVSREWRCYVDGRVVERSSSAPRV
jgi:hypothetical protein